jgi:hypothetical protein
MTQKRLKKFFESHPSIRPSVRPSATHPSVRPSAIHPSVRIRVLSKPFLRVKISFVVRRIGTDVLLFFTEFCLYNKQKNTWVLGNTTFISRVEVLNMISHSFAALTRDSREISCSTLEINLVFPRTHVLF